MAFYVQRSSLNLNFGEVIRDYRYINFIQHGGRLITAGTYDAAFINDIDADGYPTETTNGITFSVYLPAAGTYVIRWQGSGSIAEHSPLFNFTNKTNASKTVGAVTYNGGGSDGSIVTNGRFTVDCSGEKNGAFTVKGTTISNLLMCLESEEDAYDGGQVYRDDFLDLIADFNPSAIRFMDVQKTNTCLVVEWADRARATHITFNDTQFWPDHIVGEITGTDTYTASSYTGMPAAYTHGEFIHGWFANANTVTGATIDVGSRGAKTIKKTSTLALEVGTIKAAPTNGPNTLTYDSIVDAWLLHVADVSGSNISGMTVGHPIEKLVALCNESSVPGWFCIPLYASDDYVTSFANYIADNYEPDTVYIEYVNECWNSDFVHQRLANTWAQSLGIGGSYGWNGYRTVQIEKLMRPILGDRLKIVLASQGSQGDSASVLHDAVETVRFEDTRFTELSGDNAPIKHSDIVSYALYYSQRNIKYLDSQWTSLPELDDVKTAVDNYNSGDPVLMKQAIDWAYNDFFAANGSYLVNGGASGRFANWNTLAASFNKPVMLYEFNHVIDAPSTSWASSHAPFSDSSYGGQGGKIALFIRAWIASDQYKQALREFLRVFYSYSQSKSASLFGLCEINPWLTHPKLNFSSETGLGGSATQTPYSNWTAHKEFNNRKYTFRI